MQASTMMFFGQRGIDAEEEEQPEIARKLSTDTASTRVSDSFDGVQSDVESEHRRNELSNLGITVKNTFIHIEADEDDDTDIFVARQPKALKTWSASSLPQGW